MKMSKKITQILAVAAILFSTSFLTVQAQNSETVTPKYKKEYKALTNEEKAQKFVDRLDKKLTLTDAQKKRLTSLKVADLEQKADWKNKKQEQKAHFQEEFKKTLTQEQLNTLEEMKANRKSNFKGGKGQFNKGHGGKGNMKACCAKGGEKGMKSSCKKGNMKGMKDCCMKGKGKNWKDKSPAEKE